MNSHGIADFAHELQAVCADQLPACILSQTGLAVPAPPGLVLPAFATDGYVRETDTLVYVEQDAHTVTLTGADGTYWVALATDTWTAYAQWTTEAGTHYRWRPNATQPADVAGLLTFASVTVAGGAVTAVSPLTTVTRAAAGRALLGLGTMAEQDADAVAISGGSVAGLSSLQALTMAVNAAVDAGYGLRVGSGLFVETSGNWMSISGNRFGTYTLTVGGATRTSMLRSVGAVEVEGINEGLRCQNVGTMQGDGFSNRMAFGWDGTMQARVDGVQLGAVQITPPSDARLKQAEQADVPGLAAVLALRPLSFVYDQTARAIGFAAGRHYGLLAQEAQPHVPLAIEDDGSPEHWLGVNYQALVPVLIQAVQELTARVQALEAAAG